MDKNTFLEKLKKDGKKQVILDFDGTIADLLIDWDPWCEKLNELFYSLDGKKIEHGFSIAENDYIARFGDKVLKKIIALNFEIEQKYFSGYRICSCLTDIIPDISSFAQLHLWTSNDERTIMPIMKELSIDKYFSKIVTRDKVRFRKPDPDGFRLIYDESRLKSDYVLIGDSDKDEEAAKAAGIDFMNVAAIND